MNEIGSRRYVGGGLGCFVLAIVGGILCSQRPFICYCCCRGAFETWVCDERCASCIQIARLFPKAEGLCAAVFLFISLEAGFVVLCDKITSESRTPTKKVACCLDDTAARGAVSVGINGFCHALVAGWAGQQFCGLFYNEGFAGADQFYGPC